MKVRLKNVGVIDNCDVEFVPGINIIVGSSGSGKSTLLRSIHNIAVNEFSDSDISFGKDSMSISITCDDNIIEYSRFTKAKGDKFYYVVNGEKYSKVGRQSLSAANDILKLGDIDINEDNINFNFNMQFSTPFLIFGSQSTLYNVLTYRSQFDISRINDCYNSDVKANNSEINTSLKVRDQLNNTLSELRAKEQKLKPVEDLYSSYVSYKHSSSKLEDIRELHSKFIAQKDVDERLSHLNRLTSELQSLLSQISSLNELVNYSHAIEEVKRLESFVKLASSLETSYSRAESLSNELCSISLLNNKLSLCTKESELIGDLQTSLDKISEAINNEDYIHDVIACYNKLSSEAIISKKIKTLSGLSTASLDSIDDAISLHKSMVDMANVESSIVEIDNRLSQVNESLSSFKACPLCGSCLHQEHK